MSLPISKIMKIFDATIDRTTMIKAEESNLIPSAGRKMTGSINRRIWEIADLPKIGERYGFLKPPGEPKCIAVFTTKGGVFKTTLSLNLARLAALHNIKTCIVGLDLQGDITNAVGVNSDADDIEDLEEAISALKRSSGLDQIFENKKKLKDLILDTEIPTLKIIPETPRLAALDRSLTQANKREYWLKNNVVDPLKKDFDLIILDCSPNWNVLITNALVACDVLVSPVECKINQFRNLEVFCELTDQFRNDLNLTYSHCYVPTRYTSTRKLSTEIKTWYVKNLPNVTSSTIRESTQGEEAVAEKLSVPEYAPSSIVASEMRELVRELVDFAWPTPKRETPRTSKTSEVHA